MKKNEAKERILHKKKSKFGSQNEKKLLQSNGKNKEMRKMEKHKKHHSAKHIKVMKTAIKKGSSFKSAHKKAMKKVGA